MSHAHLQCVHNNCAKFEECHPNGVRGADYTKLVLSIQNMMEKWLSSTKCNNMMEKWLSSTKCNFLKNVQTLPKSHMHIFNVCITTVQSLKNGSLMVWEELITQSRWRLFSKNVTLFRKLHSHLQCVHNNCARFEECQPKGVRGLDYTK
jgi:hypothetical protein